MIRGKMTAAALALSELLRTVGEEPRARVIDRAARRFKLIDEARGRLAAARAEHHKAVAELRARVVGASEDIDAVRVAWAEMHKLRGAK